MRTSARLLITTPILFTAMLTSAVPTAAQATSYAPTYLDPIDLGTLGGNETRRRDRGSRGPGVHRPSIGLLFKRHH
jgi:hypothetical protein